METKKIQIDNDLCSKCGKCVKACLKNVLSQKSKKADIRIWNITQCDSCGACIKVCRRKALEIEGISLSKKPFSEQVKRKGLAFSLILFPMMLLAGFLMHPHLEQMKMIFTAQDLVERFHYNSYYHIGHLIVMFSVPFIMVSMIGIMKNLQSSGKLWGFWGCIIGVFGAFILAVDKGALCLVLSAFDTLPEADFIKISPFLQVIVDKAGLLKVCYLLPLLPIGAVIQGIGLIKEKRIKRWQGILMIAGLLLLNNPDIELISTIGTLLMCFGYFPIGIRALHNTL